MPGLVEHERVRVRRQRVGRSESAVRTARQGAEAFVPRVHQFHGFEDFVGTADRDVRGGTQHAEVSADRSGGMAGHATQQNADLTGGMRDAVQRTAPEVSDAAPRSEFGHEAERCRPAGARRSEQHGDAPIGCLEGDVVDGGRKLLAGAAGRSDGLDRPKQDSAPYRIFRAPQGPLPTAAADGENTPVKPVFAVRFPARPRSSRQTSGRSIGGLSRVAPPARKSCAGRPPWRVVVPPVGTRKPGVPVTLRWKLRGSSATPHTAS